MDFGRRIQIPLPRHLISDFPLGVRCSKMFTGFVSTARANSEQTRSRPSAIDRVLGLGSPSAVLLGPGEQPPEAPFGLPVTNDDGCGSVYKPTFSLFRQAVFRIIHPCPNNGKYSGQGASYREVDYSWTWGSVYLFRLECAEPY